MRIADHWNERLLPRLIDVVLGERMTGGWRSKAVGGAGGEVLELGFGSGLNLDHYGPEVTRVLAVEPSDLAWERAADRIARFGRPVERVGLDGARVNLADASVDAVVSTWTMCTIPDLAAALSETRRVLAPGGRLHFVEHSLSPDRRVQGVQRRVQPVWGPLAGGCHVDRDIPAALEAAGLHASNLRQRYASPLWPARPFGWFVSGAAAPVAP
jgi:SAM-dependent methyltransferase